MFMASFQAAHSHRVYRGESNLNMIQMPSCVERRRGEKERGLAKVNKKAELKYESCAAVVAAVNTSSPRDCYL